MHIPISRAYLDIILKGNIVFLTGAGISEESGIPTYVGKNAFTEEDIFNENKIKDSREMLSNAKPNAAHYYIGNKGIVITQNIDDLHERAGSENVLHLHGELNKTRIENEKERPDVVIYGETPNENIFNKAMDAISNADYIVIIGTRLLVKPASDLVFLRNKNCKIISINENQEDHLWFADYVVTEKAGEFLK